MIRKPGLMRSSRRRLHCTASISSETEGSHGAPIRLGNDTVRGDQLAAEIRWRVYQEECRFGVWR